MATPIPSFFNPSTVKDVWRVPYQARSQDARAYAQAHHITPAAEDGVRVCLLAIDVQNTFCLPDFELFVGGRSGMGAVEDTQRLCEFIYRNLGMITEIIPTLDTHVAAQIFHPVFWVNEAGENPVPMTTISLADIESGQWRVNPLVAKQFSLSGSEAGDDNGVQAFAHHYAKQLSDRGKYPLTIWPYHSMLGGIGHTLVPAFEEACFFHNIARTRQTRFEPKGDNPLTENYSILSPEVVTDAAERPIAQKNNRLIQHLLKFDAIIIAGQAKSHCVAWTISDLLAEMQTIEETSHPSLANKVYLLEDCSSPVVVPDIVDYTDEAEAAYRKFSEAGMTLVQSTSEITEWPNFPKK
jgi:nicotinamidase-related amidase